MRTLNLQATVIDKKNKANLRKFVSMINDYQSRLDSKVDEVVNYMLTYSKKVSDVFVLPQINQPKQHSKSVYNQNSKSLNRGKSFGKSIQTSFSLLGQNTQNLQEQIESLKKSVAKTIREQIRQKGRLIGTKKYIKPKFVKKQADVVPRQIRMDPFSEKNIIKANQLDKGVFNLLQRGKIGRDVDIITAFQKGNSVLNTNPAIFHNGQEKFTRNQIIKSIRVEKKEVQNISSVLNIASRIDFNSSNWAITMPQGQVNLNQKSLKYLLNTERNQVQLSKDAIYLKALHYKIIQNQEFLTFKRKNIQNWGQIATIFIQIKKLLEAYTIQIAYLDSNKLLELACHTRKIKQNELISTIVGLQKKQKPLSILQIKNQFQKQKKALQRIQSFCKFVKQRKQFLRYLKKKKVQRTIGNWFYNLKLKRNFRQNLKEFRENVNQTFLSLQTKFKQEYSHIITKKHFEIHISNKSLLGKSQYKEYLNSQITRIFNISNLNTHIIFIMPYDLQQDAISYYYKIMELQQIPNYKERVSFVSTAKQSKVFNQVRFNLSQRIYYSSKLIRELKKKIGSSPAFFKISYPSKTDISLSSFMNIPILTGNLSELLQIQNRSKTFQIFKIPQLKCLRIEPNSMSLITICNQISKFCQNNKRYKNYVVKINDYYQSTGLGLLTYPFDSLPSMYTNTAFVLNSQQSQNHFSSSQFYRKLAKKGGIIQIYEQNINSIVVTAKINQKGQKQVLGTYDKISYGFVNVGYFFPQMTIENKLLIPYVNDILDKLQKMGHFGNVQISMFVDENYKIYLDKIQNYQTQISSSLYYFKFLSNGNLNSKGQYITKIVQTFEGELNNEEEIVTLQPRSYCFIPYILHFGFSQKQVSTFFQLCRMSGISFDLQNKYGSTFILLGSLKSSMGMITTAKQRKTCSKLMIKTLDFIIKQNSHNNSNQMLRQKQKRMKERQNIMALRQRLEQL